MTEAQRLAPTWHPASVIGECPLEEVGLEHSALPSSDPILPHTGHLAIQFPVSGPSISRMLCPDFCTADDFFSGYPGSAGPSASVAVSQGYLWHFNAQVRTACVKEDVISPVQLSVSSSTGPPWPSLKPTPTSWKPGFLGTL